MENESWVSIGILIATSLSFVVALVALILQFYVSRRQKEKDETPKLKVFIQDKERHDSFGGTHSCFYFVIENVGPCGITVLNCLIDGIPIEQCEELHESKSIILGAKVEPYNSARCLWIRAEDYNKVRPGSNVKLFYKSDTGRNFERDYTISGN